MHYTYRAAVRALLVGYRNSLLSCSPVLLMCFYLLVFMNKKWWWWWWWWWI